MDKEQYLKEISAKPLKKAAGAKQSKFFTPNMVKLLAGALIAVILLVVVSSILGQSGTRAKTLTETLHVRLTNLTKNGGPIDKYSKELNSSSLRALAGGLRANLSNVSRDLENLLPDLNINPGSISSKVTEDETTHLAELNDTLERARLNALLNRDFSREMTLQIASILSIQSELRERTSNRALVELLERSTASLEILEVEFTEYTNSSR